MLRVDGPALIARSISACRIPDRYGNTWQYHSRSDRHSKIACWVIAFDLMQRCGTAARTTWPRGKVVLGVNHTLRDFQTQRKKDLDLVIAQPAARRIDPGAEADVRGRWPRTGASSSTRGAALHSLTCRLAPEAPVGSVLVALEAKAAMTAHVRALPRLHDELDSSHSTTHGNSERALAVGFVMVNASPTFISPDMNKFDLVQDGAERQPAPPAAGRTASDRQGQRDPAALRGERRRASTRSG